MVEAYAMSSHSKCNICQDQCVIQTSRIMFADANALSPNDNIDAGTKTLNGFKYVWDSHSEHADWFIKVCVISLYT